MGHDSSDYMTCFKCELSEIDLRSERPGPDSEIYTCCKEHIFCASCFPKFHKQVLNDEIKSDFSFELDKEECPICNHDFVTDTDMLKYLLKKLKTTKKKITIEMRKK